MNNSLPNLESIFDGSYFFGRFCPTCKKLITKRDNLYALAELGECLSCDHVRGEAIYEENRPEEQGSTYEDFVK